MTKKRRAKKRRASASGGDERGLTPKQRAFVEAYTGASAGNATDAARRAGYTGSPATLAVTGAKTLKIPKIRAAIDAHVEATRSRAVMDRRERTELLTAIARGEVDDFEETVVHTKDGTERVVQPARAKLKERIKAIHLLGKMDGDYVERIKHEGDPLSRLADSLQAALSQDIDDESDRA